MANYGNHEQHVKAGQQSHKNSDGNNNGSNMRGRDSDGQFASDSSRSGSSNSGNDRSSSSGTRGGSHEQHVKAGQQSHKNSR